MTDKKETPTPKESREAVSTGSDRRVVLAEGDPDDTSHLSDARYARHSTDPSLRRK